MKYINILLCDVIVSLFILLSACAPAQIQVLSTQTNTAWAKATNTAALSIDPIQTATNIPTATPGLSCLSINSDIQFNLPKESSEFEASILNYLNEGGDPAKIGATVSKSETLTLYALSADINGDLLPEVVVSIGDILGGPAIILLYRCEQDSYQLAKLFTLDNTASGIPEFATKIFASEPPFMILRTWYRGWGQDFLAIGWHNSEWQIIYLATGTTPSEIALFDQNKDGIKEVLVKTRTAATPGGGVSRVIIDTYSWDGKEFTPTSDAMPPGPDRVHYLQDAEKAWRQRNPLLAVAYYEAAARDPNLSSYGTTYEWEHKQTYLAKPYQQAFAFFRIVAIWFFLDRPEVASEYIEEMSDAFPTGKPGNEFVQAAQELADWYEKDPHFPLACAKAVDLLDAKYPEIVRHHLGDWGVANPLYFATSDICKFQ